MHARTCKCTHPGHMQTERTWETLCHACVHTDSNSRRITDEQHATFLEIDTGYRASVSTTLRLNALFFFDSITGSRLHCLYCRLRLRRRKEAAAAAAAAAAGSLYSWCTQMRSRSRSRMLSLLGGGVTYDLTNKRLRLSVDKVNIG